MSSKYYFSCGCVLDAVSSLYCVPLRDTLEYILCHIWFFVIRILSIRPPLLCPRCCAGESQDCPPQDWPHGGQSWGGQSWALSVIRIAHLNYNTIFSLPAWFRVVTIDSGCFDMISTYLIQSASMFNWFIIRFIMDTQIHKKVQLNIFTHWVICLSSIQPWKGKWAGRGLLYKYIFSSVHKCVQCSK